MIVTTPPELSTTSVGNGRPTVANGCPSSVGTMKSDRRVKRGSSSSGSRKKLGPVETNTIRNGWRGVSPEMDDMCAFKGITDCEMSILLGDVVWTFLQISRHFYSPTTVTVTVNVTKSPKASVTVYTMSCGPMPSRLLLAGDVATVTASPELSDTPDGKGKLAMANASLKSVETSKSGGAVKRGGSKSARKRQVYCKPNVYRWSGYNVNLIFAEYFAFTLNSHI